MDSTKTVKPGRCTTILVAGVLMLLCLFGQQLILAEDALSVKSDSEKKVYAVGAGDEKDNALDVQHNKEKTVYSIGPNKTKRDEEAKDKERSWGMLKNVGIIIDERQDTHHHNQNQ